MDERWHILLRYWQSREFRHSLTFSFLVGALRNPIGSTSGFEGRGFTEITDLIDSIRNHRANYYYLHIYRCPDLKNLVLTEIRNSPPSAAMVPIPSSSDAYSSLYASDGVEAHSQAPLDELIHTIWKENGNAIEAGKFSCRGGHFESFNDYDLKVIKSALVS